MNTEQELNLIETDDENISQIVDDADNGRFVGVLMDTRGFNKCWTFSIYNHDFSADDVYIVHQSNAADIQTAFQCWKNGDAGKVIIPDIPAIVGIENEPGD